MQFLCTREDGLSSGPGHLLIYLKTLYGMMFYMQDMQKSTLNSKMFSQFQVIEIKK